MKTQCLPPEQLGGFLTWTEEASRRGIDLGVVLSDLLRRANGLIPSQLGGIELRLPTAGGSRASDELAVVACFGELPEGLPGRRLPVGHGLARRTYRTGRAHLTPSEDDGQLAADGIGSQAASPPRAAICAPLTLGDDTVGVVELAEPRLQAEYGLRELALLEVLAQTISAWLTVAADARRAREMATRDNLTGLYNDRHLHRVLDRRHHAARRRRRARGARCDWHQEPTPARSRPGDVSRQGRWSQPRGGSLGRRHPRRRDATGRRLSLPARTA